MFYDGPDLNHPILVGWNRNSFVYCFSHWGSTDDFFFVTDFHCFFGGQSRHFKLSCETLYMLSPRLCIIIVFFSQKVNVIFVILLITIPSPSKGIISLSYIYFFRCYRFRNDTWPEYLSEFVYL